MTARTITLPGTPASLSRARCFTRAVLAGNPGADAAEMCVSEIAANTVTHGHAAEYTVKIDAGPGVIVIEVTGGVTAPVTVPAQRPGEDSEHGRGLLIVAALAGRVEFTAGRVRAELAVTVPATAGRAA